MIVIPFVLLVALSGSLTGYLSLRNGQEAVNNVASQLRNEISARIQERVHNYLETAHLVNQLYANDIGLGLLNLEVKDNDSQTIEHYFWQKIQSFDQVTNVFIGLPTGEVYGARRLSNNQQPQTIVANATTQGSLNYYNTDNNGNRKEVVDAAPKYDPRTRSWYKDAVAAARPIWSAIYPEFATKALAITAAQPAYGADGKLLGVLGSTAILTRINEFLHGLKSGKTGQTFIMERSGLLVAASTFDSVFNTGKTGTPERLKAANSPNLQIQAAAVNLEQHFGDLKHIKEAQQLEFQLNNQRQFVQVSPLTDNRGLDWLVVVAIPEIDFMEQINANTQITIWLSIIALILTTFIGLLTARAIIQPILRLNSVTKKFADGDWDQKIPTERSDELGELAKSFNSMGEQVKKSFVALEEANATLEHKVVERTKELAQALNELKASQSQLIQSEKMASLGQMVAGVAHEINTPLGYVRSNVEMTRDQSVELEQIINLADGLLRLMVSEGVSEDELAEQLGAVAEAVEGLRENDTFADIAALFKDILKGIDQIAELVLNLKDFSRVDNVRARNVDLNASLDSVLVIGHHAIGPKIEIKKEYSTLPLIECSPSHINQVLLNIITNAAQAMDSVGCITLRSMSDEAGVVIEIEDTGKGIPEDIRGKIFDPFFTTKPVGQGTGLGLSICYKIIEQHKGDIRVESEVGKGTKFIIMLPRQASSS
jgi:signal transduction histidine kinase